jgi:putative PIN family toxin of toxin-antitoxin system
MKPVVIDTNVFISALGKADTPPRAILRLCFAGRLQPLMGAALFAEYEDVLARDRLFTDCPLNRSERQRFFADFASICKWTPVYYLWRPNLPDEADNHLIELAMAGGAEAIITGNVRDLRRGELLFPSLAVKTPREFLDDLKERKET